MSSVNPGTSINFDAQALHDAEEAEYQREELERQNEVRNIQCTCLQYNLHIISPIIPLHIMPPYSITVISLEFGCPFI